MAGLKAKGGKKNRKLGRNKRYCDRRKADGREAHNKLRRMRRHLRRHPHDQSGLSKFKAAGGSEMYLTTRQLPPEQM